MPRYSIATVISLGLLGCTEKTDEPAVQVQAAKPTKSSDSNSSQGPEGPHRRRSQSSRRQECLARSQRQPASRARQCVCMLCAKARLKSSCAVASRKSTSRF